MSRDELPGFVRFSGREERVGEEEGQWDRGGDGWSVGRRYHQQFCESYALQVGGQCGELDICVRTNLWGQFVQGALYFMVGLE